MCHIGGFEPVVDFLTSTLSIGTTTTEGKTSICSGSGTTILLEGKTVISSTGKTAGPSKIDINRRTCDQVIIREMMMNHTVNLWIFHTNLEWKYRFHEHHISTNKEGLTF